MTPRFSRKKFGYDTRQVDEYIDNIRAENQRLTSVNDQLFRLWLTELRQLSLSNAKLTGKKIGTVELSYDKIGQYLEESYRLQKQQPARPPLEAVPPVKRPPVAQAPPQAAAQAPPSPPKKAPRKKSRSRISITGSLFCTVLLLLVVAVYFLATGDPTRPPRDIMGFSVMTVLTRSMQDEIPQNSLIVTRRVDPETIAIGDDITFLTPNNTTVTHRVIGIYPSFSNTGRPAFETQGVMNTNPDPEPVLAANLVGRVIFHNLTLGNTVLFIRDNVIIVAFFTLLAIGLILLLRVMVFKNFKEEEQERFNLDRDPDFPERRSF